MHICFLSHEYPLWATGGIGSFIQTIGRGLVEKGHKVTVLGMGKNKNEELFNDKGVEVIRLPAPRFFKKAGSLFENALALRRKLLFLHSHSPIDVVEAPEAGFYFLLGKYPFAKVVRMHGGHHFFSESERRKIKFGKGLLEKISFNNADAFIAVSQFVLKHTSKYLSTGKKKVEIIRIPVNEAIFRKADPVRIKKHRLVFAGTVCEKKGIRQLIQSLEMVKTRYPEVHLDVYGRDWTFPDKSSYVEFLKDSFPPEILSHVTFHGAVKFSEIPGKYEEAELCVFPSHMETQGLVAPEAMMMGKPVLFSETGPGKETVEHLKTGLLCNPYDPADIADKIMYAFDNPDEIRVIAESGQAYVKKEFNIDNIIDQNVSFYQKVMTLL